MHGISEKMADFNTFNINYYEDKDLHVLFTSTKFNLIVQSNDVMLNDALAKRKYCE